VARLTVSPEAQADVDEILTYLQRAAGRPVAARHGDRFLVAFRHQVDFPETGAKRPQFGADMRIWAVAPYIVFYRVAVEDGTVRVPHGRRNVTTRLFS